MMTDLCPVADLKIALLGAGLFVFGLSLGWCLDALTRPGALSFIRRRIHL